MELEELSAVNGDRESIVERRGRRTKSKKAKFKSSLLLAISTTPKTPAYELKNASSSDNPGILSHQGKTLHRFSPKCIGEGILDSCKSQCKN